MTEAGVKREQTIRRRLASLGMLGDAVNAMKSLSAHHLRLARDTLASAREYRDGIERLLASAGIAQEGPTATSTALLLVAADLGLCDGYNQQLAAAAVEQLTRPGLVYCMGRRPLPALRRAGIELERSYPAAPSVDGLTRVLLTIADDVLGDYLEGRFGTLTVISARFDGVGAFTPTLTRVLPVRPAIDGVPRAVTPYVSRTALARVAVREYLYSTLYELLLDALAAEHGTRLVATQSAGQWLDEKIRGLRRQLAGVRQEAGTQEVLDVASGARWRRRH
jgi:F-type H+-transporting ATPase subunit gamma